MTAIEPMADVTFGGGVDTVLQSARTSPPPATLEEARNQPGRRERIEEITRRIESEGIKYVFFQQVSITGRVMGKGVVASFFPQVAEKGYQLVYGATANLFTDRAGDYIGFGPEESELAAIADLDTFARLPWDPRVARVFCDCYDTETGELLDADPRQNLKRVVAEFEEELGYSFLIGIEPEMMWLKQERGRRSARRRDQAVLLPHPPVRGTASGAARRGRVRAGARARHELRRPRGRARPARAELPLRPAGQDRRQHHHLPPDLRGGGPQARPPPHLHAQALQRRVGQRAPPPLHALRRGRQQRLPRPERARPSCPTPPATSSAACSTTSGRSCAWATRP